MNHAVQTPYHKVGQPLNASGKGEKLLQRIKNRRKRQKNMPKPVKTYSEVVRDSLKVAIQYESNPTEGLTHAQDETLKYNLMEALDNIPWSSTTSRPCFKLSSRRIDVCDDATSLEWLRSAVIGINDKGGPTLV
jgi:hypothetical protein